MFYFKGILSVNNYLRALCNLLYTLLKFYHYGYSIQSIVCLYSVIVMFFLITIIIDFFAISLKPNESTKDSFKKERSYSCNGLPINYKLGAEKRASGTCLYIIFWQNSHLY